MKRNILVMLVCLILVILTGCMSEEEISSIKDILVKNNVIKSEWTYVDSLDGLGEDVGGEANMPDYNESYEVYEYNGNYICVVIT